MSLSGQTYKDLRCDSEFKWPDLRPTVSGPTMWALVYAPYARVTMSGTDVSVNRCEFLPVAQPCHRTTPTIPAN